MYMFLSLCSRFQISLYQSLCSVTWKFANKLLDMAIFIIQVFLHIRCRGVGALLPLPQTLLPRQVISWWQLPPPKAHINALH